MAANGRDAEKIFSPRSVECTTFGVVATRLPSNETVIHIDNTEPDARTDTSTRPPRQAVQLKASWSTDAKKEKPRLASSRSDAD